LLVKISYRLKGYKYVTIIGVVERMYALFYIVHTITHTRLPNPAFKEVTQMKKIIKSVISTFIALIVILSVFPTAVFAEESSFEPRLTAPSKSISYYNKTLNVFSQTGYGMPNCTAYVYGRIYEITGEEPLIKRGNAGSWWSINKKNNYYEYGQEPKLGAIACWSNHVAVVEEIDGNTVTASQSHWRSTYFDTCTFSSGDNHFGQKFYGYIYACGDIMEAGETEDVQETEAAYKKEPSDIENNNDIFPNKIEFDLISGTSYEKKEEIVINSRILTNAIK